MTNSRTIIKYKKSIILKLIIVALEFICSVLISRSLETSLRGEYTYILSIANLIQLVLVLGIGNAYPTIKKTGQQNAKEKVVGMLFLTSIIYFFVFIVLKLIVNIDSYILVLSYLLIIENQLIFLSIVDDILQKNKVTLFSTIIHLIVLFFIFLFYKKNLFAVMTAVIVHHIILIIALFKSNKIFLIKWKKYINLDSVKLILNTSLPIMLMNLLMYINYHADIIFLKIFKVESSTIGVYGVAVSLGNMLWIIPDAFKEVIYNRATQEDNQVEVFISILINFFICCILFIGFIAFGKIFIKIVYGVEYLKSYQLVIMMFIGTFPMILYKLIHPLYIANSKSRIVVILLLIAAVSNIIGNVILIPKYGGMGAAISTIISYSICGIIFYIKFRLDYKFNSIVAIKRIKNLNIKNIIKI